MIYFALIAVLTTFLYADVVCSLRNQAGLDSE